MKKMLIVDDSAVMRKNLRLLLSSAGYDVVAEAANGADGVRLYKEHRPDLVTMDVTMPVLGGIEAVKAIVDYDPCAVILVVSAFDQRSTLFEAMELGAKMYIIKPITRDKLLGAVEKLLGEAGGSGDGDGDGDEGTGAGVRSEDSLQSAAASAAAVESTGKSVHGIRTVGRSVDSIASAGATVDGPSHLSAALGGTLPDRPGSPRVQIENRNGTFYVAVTEETEAASLESMRQALQGLLFIRPLRVAIDFGALPEAAPELLRLAGALLEPVAQAGGDARLLASDPALRAQLQRLHPALAVHADA